MRKFKYKAFFLFVVQFFVMASSTGLYAELQANSKIK